MLNTVKLHSEIQYVRTILVQVALVFPVISFIDFFLSFQDPLKDHACVSCHDFVIPLVCFNFEQLKKIISLFAALGLTCVTRDLLLCLMDSLVLAHGLSSCSARA